MCKGAYRLRVPMKAAQVSQKSSMEINVSWDLTTCLFNSRCKVALDGDVNMVVIAGDDKVDGSVEIPMTTSSTGLERSWFRQPKPAIYALHRTKVPLQRRAQPGSV